LIFITYCICDKFRFQIFFANMLRSIARAVCPSASGGANAIGMLAVDAVEKAKSGHPGAPMGMVDITEVRWSTKRAPTPCAPEFAACYGHCHAQGDLHGRLSIVGHGSRARCDTAALLKHHDIDSLDKERV
jgi:hypothetical protein